MTKKPPRRDPVIVYKREDKRMRPFLPKTGGFRFGRDHAPKPPQRPKKPKETKAVIPEKVRLHSQNLELIQALPSPEKEMARVCYFMCYLVHETKSNTELFPLKHNVLEKIFRTGHPGLTVHHIRRGDREVYHLSPEAKKKWEEETGSNKHHVRMYLSGKCKVEYEEGYFDLYNFHIVVEPFRFSFYLPIHQAPWMDNRRISRRKFHYPQTVEYGLVNGQQVTTSRKATMIPLEMLKQELQAFLDADLGV